MEAVLRLLWGEGLDAVSRELCVSASSLARWWDEFLVGGQAALRSRQTDARDEEVCRLLTKIGEMGMDNELPYETTHRMEANPPPRRRPRR